MEQKKRELAQNIRKQEHEITIDLLELLAMIGHHLLLIIETGICFGAVVFLVCSLLISPKYESVTKVYILNRQSDSVTVTYSDLQSGASLTKDYTELIKSLPVLEQVKAQLQLTISTEELAGRISVTSPTDTRIINISVTDTDPYRANAMADAVRVAAAKQIAQVMDIEAVNIVQKASYPDAPSSPSTRMFMLVGAMFGMLLAIIGVFVLYVQDDTIKTAEDVETILGVSVLGNIPVLKSETGAKKKKRQRVSKAGKHKTGR